MGASSRPTCTPGSRSRGRCCRAPRTRAGSAPRAALPGERAVEIVEARDVVAGALLRVLDRGVRLHDEGPVGGLGEQQLAGRLVEGAPLQVVGLLVAPGQLHHALGRHVQVRVDPVVARVEPHLGVALGAPGAHRRLRDSQLGVRAPGTREGVIGLHHVLVVVHLAEQEVQEVGALEPPVAEQLGVVGAHDEGRPVHGARAGCSTCFWRFSRKLPAWLAAFSRAQART